MTDRLTPVGSGRAAEAFIGAAGMPVEIVHDDLVGNVAAGGREISAGPEALAPVSLADMLELLLDLSRRSPFRPAHEVADGDMGRDFDEHMDMISRQRAVDDRDAHLGAYLPDDVAHPQAHLA